VGNTVVHIVEIALSFGYFKRQLPPRVVAIVLDLEKHVQRFGPSWLFRIGLTSSGLIESVKN